MRIITGIARNTPLQTLDGDETRPTSERVKEALFSMIQFEIEGRRVLDLFAGSGQLGLEALSRGAEHCTFIDNSRQASDIIIANAKKAKLFDKCRISATDVSAALKSCADRDKFDIVFIDPPYASDEVAKSLRLIISGNLLGENATVVCETPCPPAGKKGHKKDDGAEDEIFKSVFGGDEELRNKYNVKKTNAYGISRITLLERVK